MPYVQFEITPEENRIERTLFLKILEIIHYELRWIHANPSIYGDDQGKRILNLYSPCPEALEAQANQLLDKIRNAGEKILWITGEKGKGKTTIMNYFLNTKTGKLNNTKTDEFNGITWVRIEITKVYKELYTLCSKELKRIRYLQNLKETEKVEFRKRKLSKRVYDYLESYFFAQLIYVWLRYGIKWKTDTVLGSISEKEVMDEIRNKFGDLNLAQLYHGWNMLKNNILREPRFLNSMDWKPINWKYTKYVGQVLLSLFAKNQKKLILFIDGIDNVDYNSLLKEALIERFDEFLEEIQRESSIFRILIALRPEVKIELERKFHHLIQYGFVEREPTYIEEENRFPLCVSSAKKITGRNEIETLPEDSKIQKQLIGKLLNLNRELLEKDSIEDILKRHSEDTFEPGIGTGTELKNLYKKEICKTDEEKRRFILHLFNILKYIGKIDTELIEDIEWFYFHFPGLLLQAIIEKNTLNPEKAGWNREELVELQKEINFSLKQKKLIYNLISERGNYKENGKSWKTEKEENSEKNIKLQKIENTLKKLKDVEHKVLKFIFGNNRREYLDALWNSYVYLRKYSSSRKNMNNVKEYMSSVRRGKFMLLESIFRNHNYYCPMPEREKYFVPPYISITALNLLNPNSSKESSFSPLIPVFILTELIKNQELSKREIIASVNRAFGSVAENWLDSILDAFLEAYYISGNGKYTLSDKGRFIYEYTFRDINVFSTLAYNGLIEQTYRDKLRKYTSSPEKENPWEKYLSTTLRNTFLLIAFWEREMEKFKLDDKFKLYDNRELKEDIDYFLQVLFVEKIKDTSGGETPISTIMNAIFGEYETERMDRSLKSKLEWVIGKMTEASSVMSFYELADDYKDNPLGLLRLFKNPYDPHTGKVIKIDKADIYRLFKILSFYKPFTFLSQPEVAISTKEVRELLFSGKQITHEEMKEEFRENLNNLTLPPGFKDWMLNIINTLRENSKFKAQGS